MRGDRARGRARRGRPAVYGDDVAGRVGGVTVDETVDVAGWCSCKRFERLRDEIEFICYI